MRDPQILAPFSRTYLCFLGIHPTRDVQKINFPDATSRKESGFIEDLDTGVLFNYRCSPIGHYDYQPRLFVR